MSPEAQRIAIAEACGYSDFGFMAVTLLHDRRVMWCKKSQKHIPLPDYLNDLNAMREVEMYFHSRWNEQNIYVSALRQVVGRVKHSGETIEFAMLNASAAQRAEAFLRTIGKWEDSK